jgi:hypothetical protein
MEVQELFPLNHQFAQQTRTQGFLHTTKLKTKIRKITAESTQERLEVQKVVSLEPSVHTNQPTAIEPI